MSGGGSVPSSTVIGPRGAAPFIAFVVLARGLLNRLFTRIYLPEDATALPPAGCCRRCPRTAEDPSWAPESPTVGYVSTCVAKGRRDGLPRLPERTR